MSFANDVSDTLSHWNPSPVLLYHQLSSTTSVEDPLRLAVSPETFEAQLHYLQGKGYRSFTLEELMAKRSAGGTGGNKLIAITFDDGYLDNFTNAFPIIRKYGFTATIFLATGHIGKNNAWDFGHTPLMNWTQIQQMADYGISFQSHSVSHADLVALPDAEVLNELVQSRDSIRKALGFPVQHLAYPFGSYDERIMALAEKAGYQWGWAAGLATGKRFSMERFQIGSRDTGLYFVIKASRWGSKIRRLRSTFRLGG